MNQRSEAEMGYLNRAFTQNQKFHKISGWNGPRV